MICKSCGNSFSIWAIIDGRERNLNKRKYCLTCSPFGKHNTRKICLDGTPEKTCKDCGKSCGFRRNRCKSCNIVRYRKSIKQRLVDAKGGKCLICGYDKCMRNLTFHHVNPMEKEFQITGSTKAFEKLKKEAEKCVLLCCRCHGEVHAGLISIPLYHNW